ncbi:MAG TPA: four helix bundle protein [Vicinamibacterales bacterium]|nr:four helix bundle protein [Vicinamibacterales bacterium]
MWQAGMELTVSTYELSGRLPPEEKFGLASQMRRAAVSIVSNVAEGHAFRTRPRAYRRHVRIALGSFAELETQVELVSRLRLANGRQLRQVQVHMTRVGQLLHGLLRALRAVKENSFEDC